MENPGAQEHRPTPDTPDNPGEESGGAYIRPSPGARPDDSHNRRYEEANFDRRCS